MQPTARARFLDDYRRIRHAEGRGSEDPAYYRALPFQDLGGTNAGQWAIRARSYVYFEKRVLGALAANGPLDILDAGAGNCWLSYRLALGGHRPIAIDIFDDARDGLAAARHYPVRFRTVEAEFDRLPFRSGQSFDLVVFNASIHYSTDYRSTLVEALRVLRPKGSIAILDSPVYKRREHGERMRAERHNHFERTYGFRSDALPSIEFFDEEMLAGLARDLRLRWRIHKPWYGLRWHLRHFQAWLQRRRPPSRFWILVATRSPA